ncbi:hypothetical protein RHSIM_Rhsim13G0193800 [Rhododendron simsii]|uniref:Uncharacterized protein n=1 Tax=Rhododendron simsii TaxID=118357 RepID=A0A834G493_RHOSS|nr:hypothetical protein RHSIM_Rhsim13G0193800 [Rhododendron simsii]
MDTRTNGYFTNLMQSGSNEEQFMRESQYFNPNVQVTTQETQFTAAMGSIFKKQRSGNFTVEEDKLLVSAWLNISMDAIQGVLFCELSKGSLEWQAVGLIHFVIWQRWWRRCCGEEPRLSPHPLVRPQCLCASLNGGGLSMGINVNQTQALALHAARSVTTPPISRCSGKNPFPKFC